MGQSINMYVVNVFTDSNGKFGSPTGVILDEENGLSPERRQEIARKAGFSETVFINDLEKGDVSIFALQSEIPFAGAPLVGTAWYMAKSKGERVTSITCQGRVIKVLNDEDLTWIVVEDASTLPPWNLRQLADQDEVDNLSPSDDLVQEHTIAWAWVDQTTKAGKIRARTFAPDWEIVEEEANGSGSMLLANELGRSLLIKHGEGSYIRASAGDAGIAVGGLVVETTVLKF